MLELLDLDKQLSKPDYSARMEKLQESLRRLQYAAQQAQIPIIVCLEGWNGCGRGEIVKKLSEKLDPRLCRFRRGAAPTPLEQRYHFLWRYQIALPNDGEMTVFDHSWYGRVLVERCDRLVKKKLWRQAYQQINEFERWLTDDGQVLVKFWLHVSKAEQRRRFRAFKLDPLLRVKLTKEYRRQHRRYGRWLRAVEEMLQKTGSANAPWTVIEAHDLRWPRVRVFETLIKCIEEALERRSAHPEAVSRSAAAIAALQAASRQARLAAGSEQTVAPQPVTRKPVARKRKRRRAAPAAPASPRKAKADRARPPLKVVPPRMPENQPPIPPAEVTSA
jgi:polyphosphate kinase 2 (PPK2 family)